MSEAELQVFMLVVESLVKESDSCVCACVG